MPAPPTIAIDEARRLIFSLLSATSESEILFRIAIDGADAQTAILRKLYAVTGREAEVLLVGGAGQVQPRHRRDPGLSARAR